MSTSSTVVATESPPTAGCSLGGCLHCTNEGTVCLECDATRFLANGKCKKKVFCASNKVQYLPEGSPEVKCRCGISDCFRCLMEDGPVGTATCLRCKSAKYLHNGGCVEETECSGGTVPSGPGNYGRSCEAPFACVKGKNSITNQRCKCMDPGNCFNCEYNERGHLCTKCKAGKFLHQGDCVDACPAELAHSGQGTFGLRCEPGYECRSGKNQRTGGKCKCPNRKLCQTCLYTAGNSPLQSDCIRCRAGAYLLDGICLKACPVGTVASGQGQYGRMCIRP